MRRSPLNRRAELKADPETAREFQQRARANSSRRRRPVSECTPAQRQRVAGRGCIVCGEGPCDPAHLIPRSLCPEGADDVRAVVPLCRVHHRAYDQDRSLSLLEFLEPYYREELAFAVERFGLLSTLERLTNSSWRETSI